jgi:hypothetical protein
MDLMELRRGMDWIDLAKDRGRGRAVCGNELSGSINYGEFLD